MARLPASSCRLESQPRPVAFNPYSPKDNVEPRIDFPRRRPLNSFLNFLLLGSNIARFAQNPKSQFLNPEFDICHLEFGFLTIPSFYVYKPLFLHSRVLTMLEFGHSQLSLLTSGKGLSLGETFLSC